MLMAAATPGRLYQSNGEKWILGRSPEETLNVWITVVQHIITKMCIPHVGPLLKHNSLDAQCLSHI